MPKTRPHIAIAAVTRDRGASGASGSFTPFVRAACDRDGQVERVDLATAPLVRALPNGWLVNIRTGEHVGAEDVCRNCLKAEAR